ncbi:MAG TPA: RNA polymerase sigma factor [Urbifossiella sp.]|jgi:RNA polymerase sigma factor (sigma-70 family)|nr:RNA polymerase sigma factor [Urbifossiella sp.]
MTGPRPADILRHLADAGAAADRDLLRRYATTRDGEAFAELVRRHGPVVLAACRRGVRHAHDADDAFQAVFLILARRAGAIEKADLLGNWLYRVAVRVACDARRAAYRRRMREVQAVDVPEPVAPGPVAGDDLGPVLDEELARLAAWYREAVVLCDVRGLSRAEAAAQLGVPLGTLASRLAGGRKRLAARLARRGVTLSVAAALVEARAVAVSDSLHTRTCGLVADWSAGGGVPAAVLRLARGGLTVRKTFFLGLVAAAALAAVGVGHAARPAAEPQPPTPAPPAPPVAAGKADGPAPGAAEPGFAFSPRPRKVADLPIKEVQQVMWSPDGKWLAVVGPETAEKPERKGLDAVIIEPVFADNTARKILELPQSGTLVGFAPAKGDLAVVTDLREFTLVSGIHQLQFWHPFSAVPGGDEGRRFPVRYYSPSWSMDLEVTATQGYVLSVDGQTYRTVQSVGTVNAPRVELQEVSTGMGQEQKTLTAAAGLRGTLTAGGKTLFVAKDNTTVEAYTVPGEKPIWSHTSDPEAKVDQLWPSAGGEVLIVTHQNHQVTSLDGKSGRALPRLEGVGRAGSSLRVVPQTFSAGARLFAAGVVPMTKDGGIDHDKVAIMVWNPRTGKLVKTWRAHAILAFHPTRPILAMLERNGERTRLGLWDFTEQP